MRSTNRPRYRLLKSLEASQKEAVASSSMTASCDNFMNAFALHLQASSIQMGFLTAFPPLIGALMQMVSVWLGTLFRRKYIVVLTSSLQTLLMFGFAILSALRTPDLVQALISLVILYQGTSNLIQPQWRAWIGSLVPAKQRGSFFASRTRLTMGTSMAVFIAGGLVLAASAGINQTWIGFCLLFFIAGVGRAFSTYFLCLMDDPSDNERNESTQKVLTTFRVFKESLHEPVFRNYTFFIAGMQGMVAISAPFFAVYMLNELGFTYIEYTLNLMASIATQFVMLRYWGRYCDNHGHRLVMLVCGAGLPLAPLLWLISPNFFYLLLVQVIAGLSWSGFNLATANYLYDIRPHHSSFSTYAAVQSFISAVMVFFGGISGGYLASHSEQISGWLPFSLGSSLFIVFAVSGVLRASVLFWFIPRAEEPAIRTRPQLLHLILRVSRFNAISGVVLDWMTVTGKSEERDTGKSDNNDNLHNKNDPES